MKIIGFEITGARLAAGVLALAGAAALGACSFHAGTDSGGGCDDPKITGGMKSALEASTKQPIASISNVQTITKTDTGGTCKMHITATDGEEADVSYKLTKNGDDMKYESTDITQTKLAGGAPATPAAAPAAADAGAAPAAPAGDDKQ
jgi:hypothetical protein